MKRLLFADFSKPGSSGFLLRYLLFVLSPQHVRQRLTDRSRGAAHASTYAATSLLTPEKAPHFREISSMKRRM